MIFGSANRLVIRLLIFNLASHVLALLLTVPKNVQILSSQSSYVELLTYETYSHGWNLLEILLDFLLVETVTWKFQSILIGMPCQSSLYVVYITTTMTCFRVNIVLLPRLKKATYLIFNLFKNLHFVQ